MYNDRRHIIERHILYRVLLHNRKTFEKLFIIASTINLVIFACERVLFYRRHYR